MHKERNTLDLKSKAGLYLGVSLTLALFGLLGYIPGLRILGSFREDYVPMAPSTAISFIILSAVLILFQQKKLEAKKHLVILVSTVLVTAFGFLKGLEYLITPGKSFESLIVKTGSLLGEIPIGIMSASTGGIFFLSGMGILFLLFQISKKCDNRFYGNCAGFLSLSVIVLACTFILGYIYGQPLLYGKGSTVPMAITTSVSFLFLGVGQVLVVGKEYFPLSFVSGPSIKAQLLRIFLPFIFLVIFSLDFIEHAIQGYQHDHSNVLVSAFVTVAALVIAGIIVSRITRSFCDSLESAQRAVVESEELYRTITILSPVPIYKTDIKGKCTYVSSQWVNISGLSSKEALGDGWVKGIHPDDRNRVFDEWEQSVKKHKLFNLEYRYCRPDGVVTWVLGQAVPEKNADGNIVGYIGTLTDITDRKKAEEKLKISEDKFSKAFASSPDSIAITAVDNGKIIEVNEAFVKRMAIPREKAIGKTSLELNFWINSEDRSEYIRILSSQGKVRDFETNLRSHSGNILSCLLSAESIELGGKQHLISFVRDITERKKAEEALRESEANLRKQKEILEQKNIALKEILEHIEREKQQIKDDVMANIDNVIMPSLKKLKLKGGVRKHVNMIENYMENLASSFGKKITEKSIKLTSREIEICSMVKTGLTSKEIASLLSISLETVEKHRRHIRKKLGISRKDINLTTYLKTL